MIHAFALLLAVTAPAVVAQATPSPAPVASPVAAATPGISTLPVSTKGLVLPVVPVVAPNFGAPDTALPSGDIVGNDQPFVGVSLENAIAMALSRNTDLSVAQSNQRIANFQIVAAQGAYDLRFQIQPSFDYQQIPSTNSFIAGPNGTADQIVTAKGTAGVTQLLGSGGMLSAGTSAEHVNDNNVINSFNPYYETSAYIKIAQPLLRGRAIDDTRRQIQLNRINASLTTDNALLTASNTLTSVLDAYYDLVAAWRNVAIQEDGLLQAQAQSESNARLVKRGRAAPVDVVESNTQVSVFQDNVYSAIENVSRLPKSAQAVDPIQPGRPDLDGEPGSDHGR